jgi:hypothetical protein
VHLLQHILPFELIKLDQTLLSFGSVVNRRLFSIKGDDIALILTQTQQSFTSNICNPIVKTHYVLYKPLSSTDTTEEGDEEG